VKLAGRTILVTGAARGIGLELSRQLTEAGAHVIAVGRDAGALERLAAERPGRITPWPADLTDAAAVDRLVRLAPEQHPTLSVVINNAGVQLPGDFIQGDGAALAQDIRIESAVNFEAVAAICAGLLPHLRAQPSAALLNVSSGLALAPKASAPVYCATKAAVRSLTKALRYQCEDAAPNVAVIEAIMALVDTDMTQGRGSRKISARDAAAEMVRGLEQDATEIWVGRTKLLKILMRLAPGVAERMMRNG